ncbi:hypothetical protein N431DRAFT_351009 [Stipitochalara longipes BDJ]|nr:hypothetical protein N431DRAFT_351009 [Stipitochalara longipes BDJ]
MAQKRKRVVKRALLDVKEKKQETALAPLGPPAPKVPEPFPNKALVKIFRNLDVIIATSFRLVCHKFEAIYYEHHVEVFKGYNLPHPLSLEIRVQYADGTGNCLKDCLKSWMPAHLVYDDHAKKFVTVDNLGNAFLKDIGAYEKGRKARLNWCKTLNERKRFLIEDKRKFMEDIGLDTENMDFSWEMQAVGVQSIEMEPESDSD